MNTRNVTYAIDRNLPDRVYLGDHVEFDKVGFTLQEMAYSNLPVMSPKLPSATGMVPTPPPTAPGTEIGDRPNTSGDMPSVSGPAAASTLD